MRLFMSYIARHWRGELPLYLSFWLNGVLLHVALSQIFIGITMFSNSLAFDLLGFYGFFVLRLPVAVWQLVGIWRSAQRTGWLAKAARSCVALGWLYFAAATLGVIGSIGKTVAIYAKHQQHTV